VADGSGRETPGARAGFTTAEYTNGRVKTSPRGDELAAQGRP